MRHLKPRALRSSVAMVKGKRRAGQVVPGKATATIARSANPIERGRVRLDRLRVKVQTSSEAMSEADELRSLYGLDVPHSAQPVGSHLAGLQPAALGIRVDVGFPDVAQSHEAGTALDRLHLPLRRVPVREDGAVGDSAALFQVDEVPTRQGLAARRLERARIAKRPLVAA